MLSAFTAENVEYLVVGAYAMSAHGVPRATGDIDLWVRPSPDNAKRLMKALVRFGAPTLGMKAEEFEDPDLVFQIGIAPWRIDILTGIDGVTFDEATQSKKIIDIGGHEAPVIRKDLLIQNKRAAARPKDLADLALLAEHESAD